jgi:3-dehydroquinate synthetase
LSDREFNNGLAEVIKMAITYDAEFFEYLEKVDLKSLRRRENSEKLRYIIKKSL